MSDSINQQTKSSLRKNGGKRKNSSYRTLYLLVGVVLAFTLAVMLFYPQLSTYMTNTGKEKNTVSLETTFATLSAAKTNLCMGPQFIETKVDDERLQGSCCSKMDFHRYQEQVEGLKKYATIPQIPQDPYDIPVSLAKELLRYQRDIKLTAEQQRVYDDAMIMSGGHGPCCCKCWRWHAFEGQAKYLIVQKGFTAAQIAELWPLEDGCGGSGHDHGGDGTQNMMRMGN